MILLSTLSAAHSVQEWLFILFWLLPLIIYIKVSKKLGKKIDGWAIPLFLVFSWFALLCWWLVRTFKRK